MTHYVTYNELYTFALVIIGVIALLLILIRNEYNDKERISIYCFQLSAP
jgi:hypothetical protein